MADEQGVENLQPALSKEQKIGFFLLLIFAIFSIGLGILQIRNTMYAPFALNNKVLPAITDQVNSVDALRFRDTDHDGLNDFDELYVYGTSPYLYDTFSYGLSDKEVVAKGLPLCPNGRDCGTIATAGEVVVGDSASSTLVNQQAAIGPPPPDLIQSLNNPARVRQMLLDNGVDKKFLEKVSDKDLMLLVSQLLTNSTTVSSLQAINSFVGTTSSKPVQ